MIQRMEPPGLVNMDQGYPIANGHSLEQVQVQVQIQVHCLKQRPAPGAHVPITAKLGPGSEKVSLHGD